MEKRDNSRDHDQEPLANPAEQRSSVPNDLPDSKDDIEKLRGEELIMDLPEVKDIPGQEFVHVPPLGELGDTTISSAGEEGTRVFGNDDVAGETDGSRGEDNAERE